MIISVDQLTAAAELGAGGGASTFKLQVQPSRQDGLIYISNTVCTNHNAAVAGTGST